MNARMIRVMNQAKFFLAMAAAGLLLLVSIRLIPSSATRKAEFIATCAGYSLQRVEKTCENLGVRSFATHREELTKSFSNYCHCLADLWTSTGITLQPDFFSNAGQPESVQSEKTKRIIAWTRTDLTRSNYARCHNRSGINLNWIASAQLESRKKKAFPSTGREKTRPNQGR